MDCIDSLMRMAAGGRARRANVRILPRLVQDEQKRGPATRGRRMRIAATFCPGSVRRARFEKTIPIKLRYSRNR
ncbi:MULTISPECIES: hypothetical protein [Burkholderia]|uniref:Uncharacterized protein n=1 Tax=Burkholderia mayonis TaxID=1385591 RepID=A0A1B4FCI1_9BURK|nr:MULTISPECIES: hypothetical protein [Burkholderia]AOJ01376.1 hypothetical protein WS70_05650 [Burkholderia mayonis]KVE45491.1 hypothetical protein WS69_18360 [Burkholderia sp. BDU5]KVE46724.1 hypothetical protein WS70_01705 [Burkholderia mayonis]